jgi:hypothetical protein
MNTTVFDEVFKEMAKDPLIVDRFKEIARTKLEEFVPKAAEKMAEKACADISGSNNGYGYNREYGDEVKKRLNEYLATPEGSAKMDAKIQEALEKTMSGSVINEVVRHYVQAEIGQLAQKAVATALTSQKRKEDRAKKKAEKKS